MQQNNPLDDIAIRDIVPYSFGHKIGYGEVVGIRIVTDIIAGTARTGVFTEYTYTIKDGDTIHGEYRRANFEAAAIKRLEQLRKVLRGTTKNGTMIDMSYSELAELQGLAPYIEDGDTELLEAAGVPEFPDTEE